MTRFSRLWSFVRIVWGLAILLCLLGSGATLPVDAQSNAIAWSKPINLSNTPQGSGDPAIVADGYGYVHVFWSEDMGGPTMRAVDPLPEGNSIYYTRWDGEVWTPPVDILSVPYDSIANFISVVVDSKNRLHAVWTGQTSLYYSWAPGSRAYSAGAWSKPVVVGTDSARSAWMISIAVGASGDLHVAYATRGGSAGIYYTHSTNGGLDWDAPVRLSGALDAVEESYSNVKIIADAMGRLHVAWQTNQIEGYGQAVYYAKSPNGGKAWSPPIQLAYRAPGDFDVSLSCIVARGQSEVHIIYNAGVRPVGRYELISHDGGATWSDAYPILQSLEGINGFLAPLVDGVGQMHLIIDMRTRDTQVVGLYYAQWLEPGWSKVTPLATEAPYGPSAHYTAAAVRLGNELHVVWTQLRYGEIWYMRGTVPGVAQTPALSLPGLPTPTSSVPTGSTPQMVPTTHPVMPAGDTAIPDSAQAADNAMLYSVGVPILFVLAAVSGWLFVYALRHR